MAFSHGIAGAFYFNMADLSDYVESVNADLERDKVDIRVLSTDVQRLMGHRTVSLTLAGVYETASIDANAWDSFGDGDTDDGEEHVFALCPSGDTAGQYAYCGVSLTNSFSVNAGASDAVKYPVGAIGTDFADRCQILAALAARTSDASSSSQDGDAASATGGAGYIIATAVTGTVDVLIEHSENNSDWSTLVEFTQLDDAGEEVIELAADDDVYQYVRATWDVSVGGSATFFVAFARR